MSATIKAAAERSRSTLTRRRPWWQTTVRSSRSPCRSRCCALHFGTPKCQKILYPSQLLFLPRKHDPISEQERLNRFLLTIYILVRAHVAAFELHRTGWKCYKNRIGRLQAQLPVFLIKDLSPARDCVLLNQAFELRSSRLSPSVECQSESLKCMYMVPAATIVNTMEFK